MNTGRLLAEIHAKIFCACVYLQNLFRPCESVYQLGHIHLMFSIYGQPVSKLQHCIMTIRGFYQLSVALFLFLHICIAFQITGATSGINPVTGERPARLDIITFSEDPWQFDLFLLALRQIQQTDPSELLSYFQIAGWLAMRH